MDFVTPVVTPLTGTRNSLIGTPQGIDPMTHRTMSGHYTTELHTPDWQGLIQWPIAPWVGTIPQSYILRTDRDWSNDPSHHEWALYHRDTYSWLTGIDPMTHHTMSGHFTTEIHTPDWQGSIQWPIVPWVDTLPQSYILLTDRDWSNDPSHHEWTLYHRATYSWLTGIDPMTHCTMSGHFTTELHTPDWQGLIQWPIAPWVDTLPQSYILLTDRDRSNDPLYHEWTLYHRATYSWLTGIDPMTHRAMSGHFTTELHTPDWQGSIQWPIAPWVGTLPQSYILLTDRDRSNDPSHHEWALYHRATYSWLTGIDPMTHRTMSGHYTTELHTPDWQGSIQWPIAPWVDTIPQSYILLTDRDRSNDPSHHEWTLYHRATYSWLTGIDPMTHRTMSGHFTTELHTPDWQGSIQWPIAPWVGTIPQSYILLTDRDWSNDPSHHEWTLYHRATYSWLTGIDPMTHRTMSGHYTTELHTPDWQGLIQWPIAPWVDTIPQSYILLTDRDRSNDPSHHEWALYHRATYSWLTGIDPMTHRTMSGHYTTELHTPDWQGSIQWPIAPWVDTLPQSYILLTDRDWSNDPSHHEWTLYHRATYSWLTGIDPMTHRTMSGHFTTELHTPDWLSDGVVRVFAHGEIDHRIDPSWWTHWAISRSSQCPTTGVIE